MICCNSAFEQGNLDLWRYINAFIIIFIIIIKALDLYYSYGCQLEPWLFTAALVVYWSLSCEAGLSNPIDTFFTVSLKFLLEDD